MTGKRAPDNVEVNVLYTLNILTVTWKMCDGRATQSRMALDLPVGDGYFNGLLFVASTYWFGKHAGGLSFTA